MTRIEKYKDLRNELQRVKNKDKYDLTKLLIYFTPYLNNTFSLLICNEHKYAIYFKQVATLDDLCEWLESESEND